MFFELIEIKKRVCKCVGCGGDLKEGFDEYIKDDLDELFYVCYKGYDYVWIVKEILLEDI